ncbi:uncharacterized protein LOC101891229 [Musca domestica]|uniref:Uncharacterized protein LOC101891229 n=1 Tax=Musca domestica TaxID=7370 RepID=A0A1I8MV32_MUSDO|nr:uncharacterized protein LOC101891229 [Musca domestica]
MLSGLQVILMCGLVATVLGNSLSSDSMWGNREPGDKMVFDRNVTLPKKIARYQDVKLNYDPWFIKPTITAIVLKNFKPKEQPIVQIVKGGVGQKSAEIHLSTQRSEGMRVRLMIFGKKTE